MAPIKTDGRILHAVFKVDVDQPFACIRQAATDYRDTSPVLLIYPTACITEDSICLVCPLGTSETCH